MKMSDENLKKKLWQVFLDVESGKISTEKAKTMANVSKEIINTTYLQLNASRQIQAKVDSKQITSFLDAEEGGKEDDFLLKLKGE